jgi:hypothetical protein
LFPLNKQGVALMNTKKLIAGVGVAISLAVPMSLSVVHPSSAGMNGQQLEIRTRSNWVKVVGKNQNGQTVTWNGSGASPFKTHGWWWVGTVGVWTSSACCQVNVPKTQLSNWVVVGC